MLPTRSDEEPKFDERIEKDFSSSDFLDLLEIDRGFAERAAECGLRSFHIMAGAFVSIKKFGELRGCIGTILPCRASLAEEICANAISAAAHDPRFPRVSADELDDLVYDVDVLSVPESIDSEKDLDPRRYGVIVSAADGRRGLLLPDLEGVDTISEQVGIAARKGGIDLGRDAYSLERFTVTRHA